jgi:hypothetical protein
MPTRKERTMLKLAWYLVTDTDYWTGLAEFPRLPQAPDLAATLTGLFGDEAGVSAGHTATAVEVMLRMVEHLSDAVPHAPATVADRAQFARLVLSFNLLLAHLAQISGRLAHQANTGTGADLSNLSATDRTALTQALATVSCRLEESAALFNQAHLAATNTTRRQPRR